MSTLIKSLTSQASQDHMKKSACSFVLRGKTPALVSMKKPAVPAGSLKESPQPLRRMHRSPSDEMLLTELAVDAKDFTIYDISSLVLVREKEQALPDGKFKCYMDNESKEFFVEVNEFSGLQAFNKTVVLNMLDVAEKEGAKKFYFCVRKGIPDYDAFVKSFSFVGFKFLNVAEQQNVSMTITHTLLVFDFENEGDL